MPMTIDTETKTDTTLYIIERQDKSAKLTCTIGKISILMKKGIDRDVIAQILLSLSKVDSTIAYEYETMCPYDDINRFRLDEYIVISYSKSTGDYKTIFNVPFSRKKALRRLALSTWKSSRHPMRIFRYYGMAIRRKSTSCWKSWVPGADGSIRSSKRTRKTSH